MNTGMRQTFGRSKAKIYDFYLGGLNGLVTSAQEMSNILQLVSVSVINFETTANDVRFDVDDSSFQLKGNTFRNANDADSWDYGNALTYFVDTRNKLVDMGFIEFSNQNQMKVFQAEGLTNIGRRALRSCDLVKEFNLPNCLSTTNDNSMNNILAERIYMPIINDISGNTTSFNVFQTGLTNTNFYVNPVMETINAGNLEPDLQQAVTNYQANITYVQNTNLPSICDSLDLLLQSGNDYQVNFNFPSSPNTIAKYLLYVDDGSMDSKYNYYQEVTNGQIVNITRNGALKIWVVAEDIYGNRSPKNEVVQLGLMSGVINTLTI